MDKCPHCGSTEPFKYKATLVTLRMGQWGTNVDEEVSVESSNFAKTVTCTDCGKRVNFDLAHSAAVEQSVQSTLLESEQIYNLQGKTIAHGKIVFDKTQSD